MTGVIARLSAGLGAAALAVALGSCATTQTGATGLGWNFLNDGGEAKLAYGPPNATAVGVMMTCQPGSGRVALSYAGPASDAASGLTLASGDTRTHFAGRTEPDAMSGGVLVTAETAANDRVLAKFARTGRLEVQAGAGASSQPARGAEKRQVAQFLTTCGAARA